MDVMNNMTYYFYFYMPCEHWFIDGIQPGRKWGYGEHEDTQAS